MPSDPIRNAAWIARSLASVWHPCTQMKHHESAPLLPIVRGEGAWLVDADGRRYLDGISSWWVNLFGHCNARINAALTAQLGTLEHTMLAGQTHPPVVELSERLAALSGLGHAFYGSDGASAVEIALKMSFHFWRNRARPAKRRFVSLEGSYHGETLGALSVTDVALFRDAYGPLLAENIRVQNPSTDATFAAIPPGTPRQSGTLSSVSNDGAGPALAALESLFETRHAQVAALILEPLVQGAAGMRFHSPAYLAGARALCDRYGVHLIADEIMTGFGRTGTMFACEQAPIRADFLCLSKGITGGYLPLSCVLTTDEVYAGFYDDDTARGFLHSHSYTGSALACRAALATLDIFVEDDVIAANRARAVRWSALAAPLAAHPRVSGFRHMGMIWAFEVREPGVNFSRRFFEAAQGHGVLLRPIGNTVYFMPPYVATDADFGLLVDATRAVLDALP